jgi:iron complex transport system substrate-binding protein
MDNPSNLKRRTKKLTNTRSIILAVALVTIIAVASVGTYLYYQGTGESQPSPSPSPTVSPPSSSSPSPFPITLTDDTNKTVTINTYPQRIFSLAPANTQTIFAVGAGAKVVGVTDWDKYPYNFSAWIEAGNMSSIGNYYNPAIEPIVALNPDLVVASLGSVDAAEQLRALGYNVLTLNPTDIDGVLQNMITIGKATGHQAEAESAVASLQQRIDAVVNAVQASATRPTVYHEIWSDPYMSVGRGTFVDNAIRMAGGQNIFENATDAYPTVSSESIISENPDIMVFPTQMGVESFWGNYTAVANRDGWSAIGAVASQKMFTVSGDIIDEPGPRQVDSLEILAKIIHPEIFGSYSGTQ